MNNSPNTIKDRSPAYAFLTDAPPLLKGGYGCHILSYNLISHIRPLVKCVITRRLRSDVQKSDIINLFNLPVYFYPDASFLHCPEKLHYIKSIYEILLSRLWTPLITREIKKSTANRLFACFGADPWFLWTTEFIRKTTNLPLDVYLVDEFEASAILNNRLRLSRKIQVWEKKLLSKADRIFTISQGFSEHLKSKLGLNASWLPLPIPECNIQYKPFIKKQPDIREITYFGAVNPLYTGGIKDLVEELSRFNSANYPYKLKLLIMTYTPKAAVEEYIGKSEYVEILTNLPIEECRERMTKSWCIFLPYTFEDKHRLMVSTSFPSRLAEVISIGRPLLVYGPQYATLPAYFKINNLALCVTEKSNLAKILTEIENYDNPTTISDYNNVLKLYHSANNILKLLKINI